MPDRQNPATTNHNPTIEIYRANILIHQGGYIIVDLLASYQVDAHWDLGFNISNLFDKKYCQTIGTMDNGNAFSEPRNFMATASYKF